MRTVLHACVRTCMHSISNVVRRPIQFPGRRRRMAMGKKVIVHACMYVYVCLCAVS